MPKGKAKTPAEAWEMWNTIILNNMWPQALDRVLLKLKKKELEPLIRNDQDVSFSSMSEVTILITL